MAPSSEPSDETLIRDHLAGSTTAFDALVSRHAAGVTAAIERLGLDHHRALDVAQEVFLSVHGLLPRYRFEGKFRSMVYSIALNRARDAKRSERRSRIVFLHDARDPGAAPGGDEASRATSYDPTPAHDERADIRAALDRVPMPFRKAVHLRDVIGLSYEEIADALGVKTGTAKSRVNRGRLLFRDVWNERMNENGDRGERSHGGGVDA